MNGLKAFFITIFVIVGLIAAAALSVIIVPIMVFIVLYYAIKILLDMHAEYDEDEYEN